MTYWIGTKDSEYRSYKKKSFVHLVLLGDVRVRVVIIFFFQSPRFSSVRVGMLAGYCTSAKTKSSVLYAYKAHHPIHGNDKESQGRLTDCLR
jgi:hypothetical protein